MLFEQPIWLTTYMKTIFQKKSRYLDENQINRDKVKNNVNIKEKVVIKIIIK